MTAVNPIPIVRNNLPDYRAALQKERERLFAKIAKIDAEMLMLNALARIVGPDEPIASAFDNVDPEYNDT